MAEVKPVDATAEFETSVQKIKIEDALKDCTIFSEPFPNNYSVVLKNHIYNKEQFGKGNAELFFGLNKASLNLSLVCKKILDNETDFKMPQIDDAKHTELQDAVAIWRKLNKDGSSFLTIKPAAFVIASFRQLGIPFYDILKNNYSIVQDAFIDLVPHEARAMLKVNLYSEKEERYSLLTKLAAWLSVNHESLRVIDRVEISKDYMKIVRDEVTPTISLLFNPYLVVDPTDQNVAAVVSFVNGLLQDSPSLQIPKEYAIACGPRTTISHSIKNYKKFLMLVNTLDELYDRRNDYAFLLKY